MSFNHKSRHKQIVSPVRGKKNRAVLAIDLPDKFKGCDERCNKMIEVLSKMEYYFPFVQSNTDSWNNIHVILCHATHAYTTLKDESEQLKFADLKISALEEQIKTLENDLIKEKTRQKINASLKTLTLEVEEELKEAIND